ncbi:MAG: hypothetical protein OXI74_01200 [Rhodospirillaceae bacterium]|nr:hypothetical protein [Rhodospirillaceae bacterium]
MMKFSLCPETLDSGTPEELATFGLFSVTANNSLLTVGQDTESADLCRGPYVAGYPLAEWLVWNWWRLRWEFGHSSDEDSRRRWDFAHCLATIGDGYAWPNITISSDGVSSFLSSEPSRQGDNVLFQYFGTARREMVPAEELEAAIDRFVGSILTRLDECGLDDSNLHRLWIDLETERNDPEIARFRRLEAQLGYDPDEADQKEMREHLRDADVLGEEAWGEVAADAALRGSACGRMVSAQEVVEIARQCGFDADANDAIVLTDDTAVPLPGNAAAWQVGKCAAQALRDQESLGGQQVSNEALARFAGTTGNAILESDRRSKEFAFSLDGEGGASHVSLRSRWETGRRFELARLVGDRVIGSSTNYAAERLLPATRSTNSYRQKMQRAFAAEFLSPFASVNAMMDGNFSEEIQSDVAEYFNVPPMVIQSQLVNNHRIDRDDAPDIAVRGATW